MFIYKKAFSSITLVIVATTSLRMTNRLLNELKSIVSYGNYKRT